MSRSMSVFIYDLEAGPIDFSGWPRYIICGLGETSRATEAPTVTSAFLLSMGKRQIDVYIDESGNFAPFTKQNPVYSVAFVFVERNEEVLPADSLHRQILLQGVSQGKDPLKDRA